MKKMDLTLLVEKGENGFYVGQLEEYPAVLSQGDNLEDLKDNILDALRLFLAIQKENIKEEYKERRVFRRRITYAS